jgi:hypothetical protein
MPTLAQRGIVVAARIRAAADLAYFVSFLVDPVLDAAVMCILHTRHRSCQYATTNMNNPNRPATHRCQNQAATLTIPKIVQEAHSSD